MSRWEADGQRLLDMIGRVFGRLTAMETRAERAERCVAAMRDEAAGRMTVKRLHEICDAVVLEGETA